MEKETVNDRVRILRKALKMTQQEFAKKFGLSDSALSRIEKSNNSLTDYNILLICTPNQLQKGETVNPDWLRTGQGEMFVKAAVFPLDERLEKLKAEERELIEIFDKLYPDNQQKVIEFAHDKLTIQDLRKQTDKEEKKEVVGIGPGNNKKTG